MVKTRREDREHYIEIGTMGVSLRLHCMREIVFFVSRTTASFTSQQARTIVQRRRSLPLRDDCPRLPSHENKVLALGFLLLSSYLHNPPNLASRSKKAKTAISAVADLSNSTTPAKPAKNGH